jgi:hypothetical protein
VRAHQNRRFWFGEEVLNARAAIGGDGVKIGWTEYDAREVYAGEIAKRLASSDACEGEQDLSSKGFEIEVVQRPECHHRKRFVFGFGVRVPSDHLDAARTPPHIRNGRRNGELHSRRR